MSPTTQDLLSPTERLRTTTYLNIQKACTYHSVRIFFLKEKGLRATVCERVRNSLKYAHADI